MIIQVKLNICLVPWCNWAGTANRGNTEILPVGWNHKVWAIPLCKWAMPTAFSLGLHL